MGVPAAALAQRVFRHALSGGFLTSYVVKLANLERHWTPGGKMLDSISKK